MNGREPIKVISKCRSFLNNMVLCRSSEIRVCGFGVPNYVGITLFALPLIQFVLMQNLTALNIGFRGFQKNANAFFISMGSIQLCTIYLCLAKQNGRIIKTVNSIQSIVDRSRSSFFDQKILFKSKNTFFQF